MTAPDDHDPLLTRALGIWAEAAVPALPDDFTAGLMAELAAQRACAAWAEAAVPALPGDFTAKLMADVAAQRAAGLWAEAAVPELPADFAATVAAKAAARPKLQVLEGGAGKPAERPAEAPAEAAEKVAPVQARRWWRWPVVALAAAGLLAVLSSRSAPTDEGPGPVARPLDVPTPQAVPSPVAVAMAEVTRVEVLGAQSVAVLSLAGEGDGAGSPVVWITDKAEDDPAGALETRMQ